MRLEQKLAEALREAVEACALFSDSNNSCADAEAEGRSVLTEYDARQPLPASQTGLVNGRGYNEDA